MTVRTDLPVATRTIENLWIPMPDGCQLAARVWMPRDAERRPVPALLEYLPYRKRDLMRARDEPMHSYYAGHGYASVRVDLRGTGDSDGVLYDEYSQQEHDDAVDAIEWIAAQSWCSGAVGMMGISWGGFNSLQVAAMGPEALKAVITLCSTDDRYADDAHYMGGCLLNENLQWGSILFTYNALPPDPAIVGERWRHLWLERLAVAHPFPALWMEHQWRDAYWEHGSICEDFSSVGCPVYAIGGWADGYSNAVPRLLGGLSVPRKGLIGPWAHNFPHDAAPGPEIGFLQEALRWWDRWLKGIDTGIMDEPMLRVWMQESARPKISHEERPGRWVAEPSWPSPHIGSQVLYLNRYRLDQEASTECKLVLQSPQTTGLAAGEWCAFGVDGEMPDDQRIDDGRSLVFDTEPLADRLEILGAPVVDLELAVDRPNAMIAVRLNDIWPDGASTRVTYGLLNLTHRDGHVAPSPLVPGRRYRVRVQLNDIAHAFAPGHRMRLAVSTSYWPIAWPSPEPVTLTVFAGTGTLTLPVRPARDEDAKLPAFAAPEHGPTIEPVTLRQAPYRRTIERDLTTGETVYTLHGDADFAGGALTRVEEIDLEFGYTLNRRFRIGESDPLSAQGEMEQDVVLRRTGWSTRVETRMRMSSTADAFLLEAELQAIEGDENVFAKSWDLRIPRDLV